LLFDNARDRESVRAFVPSVGRGQILITSRSTAWPTEQAVDVPPLSVDAAAGFLMSSTGDPDEESARELAIEMGGLSLALAQAAAYIQASATISIASYLELFAERQAELLGRGQPDSYDKTVATTWMVAVGELERDAPAAVGVLRLLACLAPE